MYGSVEGIGVCRLVSRRVRSFADGALLERSKREGASSDVECAVDVLERFFGLAVARHIEHSGAFEARPSTILLALRFQVAKRQAGKCKATLQILRGKLTWQEVRNLEADWIDRGWAKDDGPIAPVQDELLPLAIRHGNEGAVNCILSEMGASANESYIVPGLQRFTPLQSAASLTPDDETASAIIETLLKHGADISPADMASNAFPVGHCAAAGRCRALRRLLREAVGTGEGIEAQALEDIRAAASESGTLPVVAPVLSEFWADP